MNNQRLLTDEQHNFLVNHIEGRLNQELADLINKTFNLQLTGQQVKQYKRNHKLPPSGETGWFNKGHIPANKGKKFPNMPHNSGMFEKGNKPYNYMPVGSERVNGDGYVDIKIADPNKWKQKHIIIWEKAHKRKKPAGHVIIFADKNCFNFDIDNLLLVPCREFLKMNRQGLIKNDTELTKTGLLIARLQNKVQDRKKYK
ncbi:HNH endonuclease [Pectinatus haikarae]|uniref:HNH endonuclease n=1 Tax=Pectinatus haikarae TaxID=349096 RepID=UPI0027D8409C|nr:HNH endonuclease [Pectinatus haikarae]